MTAAVIKRMAADIIKQFKSRKGLSLGIVFLDDNAIRAINRKYKGKDRPTDVLSFDLGETGEIFVSLDRALENSRAFGTSLEREAALYVIHGILHLFGYDDGNAKDRARMSAVQSQILESSCTKELLSKVLTRR